MPIISEQNELLGTLVLDSKDKQAFKDQDKENLKRFSSLAAALITTARMRSFQERSAKTFQTFYQASHQFTTALKIEHVFEVLFNVIPTVVKCTRQIGIVFDEVKQVGRVVSVSGTPTDITKGFSFAINAGLYSFVFQKRKPVIIGDYQQFVDRYYRFVPNEMKNPSIRSLIIFPILDDEQRCRGLFSVESDETNIFFADVEQILTTLIENASVAFIRSVLYQRMERLATTDGLTGLNNHRHFQELLAREIERSRRYRRPLALLIMDIDHFKSFNDTYGHPVGDLVLKEISKCIQTSIRCNDIAARYGGEEFVVIIPETTEQGAKATAERIRTTIEQHIIISLDRQLRVTVSLGCSAFPENAPSQQALIDTADKALYAAKKGGRNQVVLYEIGMKENNRK
jgi:diguanylate cyclase (GGDEF)-like protein